MRSSLILAVALLISIFFTGCKRTKNLPLIGGPSSVHSWTDDGVNGAGSVLRIGNHFVIWTNSSEGGGGNESSNMHGATFRGHLKTGDSGQIEFSGESKDGKSGTAIIDGKSFDLENGQLFLVADRGNGYLVRQLDRDLSNLFFDRETLKELARTDNEIADFFAGNHAQQDAR